LGLIIFQLTPMIIQLYAGLHQVCECTPVNVQWTPRNRVLGLFIIQLYAGERTPSVDRA